MLRSTTLLCFRGVVCGGNTTTLERFDSVGGLPKQDPAANVTVRVSHSCLNYKDAMALAGMKGVCKFPVVGGIDAAGVVESVDEAQGVGAEHAPCFKVGDTVVITGNKIGQSIDGGLAERCRVQAGWCVDVPKPLTAWDSMALGSAGITAMMCIQHLEDHANLRDYRGTEHPVLVTGAGGGLGGIAIALLSRLGYTVVASTRRTDTLGPYLRDLGASDVIGGLETSRSPLGKQKWCGVIDAVGGGTLVAAASETMYRCGVASTGVAGGGALPDATVYPYILRGVRLLGVDSTLPWNCPGYETDPALWVRYRTERQALWARLAESIDTPTLQKVVAATISLDKVTAELAGTIIDGKVRGRYVVEV